MGRQLDELLASIHPDRTLLENERRADEALNSFVMPGASVPDWPSFRECLTRFVCHAENVMLRLRSPIAVNPEMHFGRACWLLSKAYGPDGAIVAANLAIHGVEGGLYGVLKTLAKSLADDFSSNEIRARVNSYWSGLSADEKIAASRDFVAKYGHLLPADLTEGNAARIHGYLPKFLEKYPELQRTLRQVGRQ